MASVRYRKEPNGNPIKNSDGSITFYIRVFLHEGGDGKQDVRSGTWRAPPGMRLSTAIKKANEEALRFEDSVKGNPGQKTGRVLFSEIAEMYFEDTDIKPMTAQNYRWALTRILAEFGHYPVDKITADMLKAFYKKLRQPGQNKNKMKAKALPALKKERTSKKLSARAVGRKADVCHHCITLAEKGEIITYNAAEKIAKALGKKVKTLFEVYGEEAYLSDTSVWQHHKTLSTFLEYAKSEGKISVNPATTLRNPPKKPKGKVKCMTSDDAKRFTSLVLEEKDIRVRVLLLLAIFTGMRRGELAGLSWRDFQETEDGCLISVVRASQYVGGVGIITTTTKTDDIRVVGLSKMVANIVLKEYRGWWEEQRIAHGADTPDSIWMGDEEERLFIKENGSPIFPSTLYQWLQKFLKENGFGKYSLHSIRHTNISLMIQRGLDVKSIQARSGHSRSSTVLDTYGYVFASFQKQAISALDDSLINENDYVTPEPEHEDDDEDEEWGDEGFDEDDDEDDED